MERDTKEIITPVGKNKIILKSWITGGEYEEIQKPITDVKLLIDTLGTAKGEINVGDASQKSTENAIRIVVVSVDDEKKNLVEKIKGMHRDDYLFVLKEVDNVYKGENFPKP